ncbi:DNA alkylation repair protein [Parabacteroides bouchesdurhonensis]|uniref:DNA alkylation repair protein n=1 Tax=Parabacteroides bouchesdurhonensis TaxID=1936995 RepID=UPI001D0C8C41|nr:DNA alkylation repair protein [Parabacteroides bouchesdurhonensis]
MEDKLREIRNKLRLGMNGVTSASMREKGIVYKLNFGVSIPEIYKIAAGYEADATLASAMWKEDVRELKIMATMLQPVNSFTHEQAEKWMSEITYPEIAEQAARNLYAKLPEADEIATHFMYNRKDIYARAIAFLVFMYLFAAGSEIENSHIDAFWVESIRSLTSTSFAAGWFEKQAALKALKCYGRQSEEQARKVLLELAYLKESDVPELQEIYNDLKFEFEYYF